jgi:hypothetical protein
MLDCVVLDEEMVCLLKIIICKTCQSYKQSFQQSGKCQSEAGEIMFIKIIYQLL